jgi:hypothetical protein
MIRCFALLVVATVAADGARAQELKLGQPAARLRHQFSGINGFRELSDGRVLVADGIDNLLVRVNLATNAIDTIGRVGAGPGEYRNPDALFALPNDATMVVDLGNARMVVFDAAGRYQESIPIAQGQPGAGPGPVPLVFPRSTDAAGRIYYQPAGAGRGASSDSGVVIRWDRKAGRFDTLARVKLPTLVTKSSGSTSNQRVSMRPAVYPVQDGWVAASDGRVALIRAPAYRVDWVQPDGTRVIGKPLSTAPVPVRDPEKKEYLAEQALTALGVRVENVNGQVSMRFSRGQSPNDDDESADLSQTEWPRVKPPVTGTSAVGPDGRLWVEVSVPAGASRVYDVIGPAGDRVLRATLPAGRRLLAVSAKGIYARHVDADGINYLERYDLPSGKP